MKKTKKLPGSAISSTQRLEALLEETENELATLEPKIERLQKQVDKLQELRLERQKLIAFKLSVKSILSGFTVLQNNESNDETLEKASHFSTFPSALSENRVFIPEAAFQEAETFLRRKNSINYELFRAIVYNGGRADTHTVKQYLLEHDIRQPGSGESFENVPLTDISSRINYLVRKGIVATEGYGAFVSRLGWRTEGAMALLSHH